MAATTSLVVAIVSLLISALTAWLTLMRRGTVLMTQPTVIFFGPDGDTEDGTREKVYLRTLLYSTARRGRIISGMYLRLRRNETSQNFSVWVHGDARSKTGLFRGSGLFIPDTGISADHHFLLPADCARFEFLVGHYRLEVFAMLVGDKKPKRLFATDLQISAHQADELSGQQYGLYFDWGPDALQYQSHLRIDPKIPKAISEALSKILDRPDKG